MSQTFPISTKVQIPGPKGHACCISLLYARSCDNSAKSHTAPGRISFRSNKSVECKSSTQSMTVPTEGLPQCA